MLIFCLCFKTKLPTITIEPAKLSDKENQSTNKNVVHAKEMVRTDCTEQKLEKFFGNAVKKSDTVHEEIQNTSVQEDVSIAEEVNPEINENFENMLLNKTNESFTETNMIVDKEEVHENAVKSSLVSRIAK